MDRSLGARMGRFRRTQGLVGFLELVHYLRHPFHSPPSMTLSFVELCAPCWAKGGGGTSNTCTACSPLAPPPSTCSCSTDTNMKHGQMTVFRNGINLIIWLVRLQHNIPTPRPQTFATSQECLSTDEIGPNITTSSETSLLSSFHSALQYVADTSGNRRAFTAKPPGMEGRRPVQR